MRPSRAFSLIIPLVLLVVALLEGLITYKVREHVHDVYWRAGIVMVLIGVGFSVAVGWVAPWLANALHRVRGQSHHEAGSLGLWVFYALTYGALFYAYVLVEQHGSAALLPHSMR
jgi:hypothetical protein